jgi:membrane fusion protein, multidrug efflux system
MRKLPPEALWATLAASLLAACNKPAQDAATTQPSGPPPVPVTLVPARSMELQRSVRIVGSLAGLETATLSNRITGRISKIYVDRGDRVQPNAKLLEIEPDRFEMSVREAEASLRQTIARLGVKEIPNDDFDINQTAPVKKAQSEYDNAKSKYDRATPLNQSKAMNDFEYLDIVSAFHTAESNLENSRDEARALCAQARQNQTQVEMRKKDFTDSVIYAPDGTTPDGLKIDSYAISERKVSTGEYLREGTSLFTLVADSTLKLQAHVPELHMADVKKGAIVSFRVEAYPGERFTGIVSIIDPTVDPLSRSFMIEALVDNAHYGNRLRPGSFVPGDVLTRSDPDRVLVPLESITSYVGITRIFKLDPAAKESDPRVKAVSVITGQQEGIKDAAGHETQWVEIAEVTGGQPITPRDQIVVSGMTKLVDGSRIAIRSAATQTASAGAP